MLVRSAFFFDPGCALIYADLYGTGNRGVVLAHGGQFNKESWRDQALALTRAGFRALAIDFRGYGQSRTGARTLQPEERQEPRRVGCD